jgi:excisionase family DNA binding protein
MRWAKGGQERALGPIVDMQLQMRQGRGNLAAQFSRPLRHWPGEASGPASTVLAVTAADSPREPTGGLEPLLSVDEVTQVLRISESGVYRLVRSGELARVKVGSRTLFEPAEVRRFIEQRRQPVTLADADHPTLEADHA